MKKIKFLTMSLVALFMACFTACESKYDVDHTAHIVGTWTYIGPNYAEALVIKEDGSVLSTGVEDGEYWENVAGTIKIKDNVATMTFEDGDDAIGHIDVVPGIAFSIYEEDGEEWTFNYCAEDLSDEIIGMWVCTDAPIDMKNDMLIQTFYENGNGLYTGYLPEASSTLLTEEVTYKVVGNLMIITGQNGGDNLHVVSRLNYAPNATSLGDLMSFCNYFPTANGLVETTTTFLRVKESLNFTGQTYDYISAHVTNAKGKDEDFTILGHTFNIAKIGAGDFDMMLRSVLFCLDTDANSIKQHFLVDGVEGNIETPIAVDGNKVTIDYSDVNPALRKVEMYMFQDADDSQLHMYMHTDAFINYFANLEVVTLLQAGKINQSDEAAIAKVFADMEARVESINVSMVFKARN